MPAFGQRFRTTQRTTFIGIGLGLLLLSAVALSISAAIEPRFPGDLPVARGVQSLATPWLDTVMEAVSFLGGRLVSIISILLLAAGVALARRWQEAMAFLAIFPLSGVLAVIKWTVDRPRPSEELVRVLENATEYSFPSGHAYYVVVFYGLLLAIIVARIHSTWLRRSIALLMLTWILLSGVSRVYLGAHWPSDVLGSVALGIPSIVLLIYLCQRLKGVGAT